MRIHSIAALPCLALFLLLPLSVAAIPAPDLGVFENESPIHADNHRRRDMHHHPGEPLTQINETEILMWHLPTPPSYWSVDIDDHDTNASRYPALMAMHVLFMSLAFFVALPVGELRCVNPITSLSLNGDKQELQCAPLNTHGMVAL